MVKNEIGRSMVEMLAVLAIMGILSVMGIRFFKLGMNKHTANELINEANKRAVALSTQVVLGRPDLSLDEFDSNTVDGGMFGSPFYGVEADTFSIPLSGVDPLVAEQMKLMVGEDSVMAITETDALDDTLILTFNSDLSKGVHQSNEEAGEINETGEVESCVADVTYNSQCQSCDSSTGKITNVSGSCTYTYSNSTTKTSTCGSGMCLDPDVTTTMKCLTNADCGGEMSGYYCKYTDYDSNSVCTADARTAIGCAGETDPANCAKSGTCTKIGSKIDLTVTSLGKVIASSARMNWWSAKNWCEAQGRHLIPVEEFVGYKDGTTLIETGSGKFGPPCVQGKTCNYWNTKPFSNMWAGSSGEDSRTLTNALDENNEPYSDRFSPVVISIAEQLRGRRNYFWMASDWNNTHCFAFHLNLEDGVIYDQNRTSYLYGALCE